MKGKKALGKLSLILISIVVFSGFIIGISDFIGNAANNYNKTDNTTLSTFNKMAEIQSKTSAYKSELEGGEVSGFSAFTLFLTGAYHALMSLLSLPSLVHSMLGGLTGTGGLLFPSWGVDVILTVLTIVIIFTIISAAFKHEV